MREPHFHTVEIVLLGAVSVAVGFHVFRFVGAKLAQQPGIPGRVGAAIGGVFSFPAQV